MSKLRDEEAQKKKLHQETELIDQIGKEGKEGRKNYQEYAKAQEKEEKAKKNRLLEEVKEKRRSRLAYNHFLAESLVKLLKEIDWPMGWIYRVAPTEKGVVMELESPQKRFYPNAFKATGEGIYDLNAVETFALRAEDIIETKGKEGMTKTKSGILLPN